jgi:hypothetical protein
MFICTFTRIGGKTKNFFEFLVLFPIRIVGSNRNACIIYKEEQACEMAGELL